MIAINEIMTCSKASKLESLPYLLLIFACNGWPKIFWTKCLFTFDQLESIADESKAMS